MDRGRRGELSIYTSSFSGLDFRSGVCLIQMSTQSVRPASKLARESEVMTMAKGRCSVAGYTEYCPCRVSQRRPWDDDGGCAFLHMMGGGKLTAKLLGPWKRAKGYAVK